MHTQILRTLVLALASSGAVTGQEEAKTARPAPLASWQIPLHSPPGDATRQEPGVWAAGPDFKTSFHDGFTFYPLLGAAYDHNLPLRWTTERVSIGGAPIGPASDSPVHWHDDWRYEYRRQAWVEAYDVRRDGVEQRFVIVSRPARVDDLEIVGRVDSELSAAARDPEHAAILFRDAAGRPLVRYGEAFAIDSGGCRTPVRTAYDGSRITLVVDGRWLSDAAFPVTVDPLTTRVRLWGANSPAAGRVHDSDAVSRRSLSASGLDTLIVHSREFSSTDLDAYGFVTTPALANPQPIWSAISTRYSTVRPRCARNEFDWVITWEVRLATHSYIAAYAHAMGSATLNSGRMRTLPVPGSRSHLRPDVGGNFTGNTPDPLIVFEDRPRGGGNGEVRGVLIDQASWTFGAPFLLANTPASSLLDRRWPSVALYRQGGDWLVAWSELWTNAVDDWDVQINRVDLHGQIGTMHLAGPHTASSWDATEPLIDGPLEDSTPSFGDGALLAYQLVQPGTRVRTAIGYQRVHWAANSSSPAVGPQRILATGGFVRPVLWGLARDTLRSSFWAMVHQEGTTLRVTRVGYSGGVVESRTVHTYSGGVGGAAVAHNFAHRSFTVVYSDNSFLWPLYGRLFTYPFAMPSPYGTSCSGSNLTAGFVPWSNAGNGDFRLHTQPSGNLPTVYMASPFQAASPVPVAGAPGCSFFIDASLMFAIGTSSIGSLPIPLPDDPPFFGDVHCQAAILDPNANALGVTLTDALFIPVR